MGAYDDTFTLRFFVQLQSHFMRPDMFSGRVDVGCGVVDAGLDDLSAIPTKGLFIVSDPPSLIISSLALILLGKFKVKRKYLSNEKRNGGSHANSIEQYPSLRYHSLQLRLI